MRKIATALAALVCVACSTTYVDRYDWDADSGEYIKETREYLGEFSYTGFTYAWKDFTEYQITDRVQKSAMRKYGKNIVLRNIAIKESRALPIIATSAVAVAGVTMVAIGSNERAVVENGIERTETDLNALGGAGIGVLLASPVFAIFFKQYKITASVFRDDVDMYHPAQLAMTEKDEFYQVSALRRASNKVKKQREAEEQNRLEQIESDRRQIANRISRHEVWVGMTKEQLIQSRGEPTRAVVKDDGIASDSVGIGTSYGRASSATTRANRVQVYYYPSMEIYIKGNVVAEIYDVIN